MMHFQPVTYLTNRVYTVLYVYVHIQALSLSVCSIAGFHWLHGNQPVTGQLTCQIYKQFGALRILIGLQSKLKSAGHVPCFRGQISMACVENLGLATAFKHTVNGRSYLEVHHKAPGSKALQILSLKANHPDDAAHWLQDMRQKQQVTMHTI